MKVAGVLLAAGQSSRFGSDKLIVPWRGRMLGEHAAAALAAVVPDRIAVCRRGSPLIAALEMLGFVIVINDAPAAGHARSLALGLAAAGDADGALVALADMPHVAPAHFAAVLRAFDGTGPVASTAAGVTGPPAILPRALWPALVRATGDTGARDWLAGATIVAAPTAMLADVDTPADLASG